MTTHNDWRALCAELAFLLESAASDILVLGSRETLIRRSIFAASLMREVARIRVYLAQPEPQGPTDEAWQWYSYCPEEGIELHLNKELAQRAAQEVMGSYAKAAHSDGWHEDMESVSWGMLLPVEHAQVIERTEAEPGSDFDEWIRYELVPSRFARPVIEPVPQQEPGP